MLGYTWFVLGGIYVYFIVYSCVRFYVFREYFKNEIEYIYTKAKATENRSLFGTPCENRTHNGPLGGGCYIHLTKEAN